MGENDSIGEKKQSSDIVASTPKKLSQTSNHDISSSSEESEKSSILNETQIFKPPENSPNNNETDEELRASTGLNLTYSLSPSQLYDKVLKAEDNYDPMMNLKDDTKNFTIDENHRYLANSYANNFDSSHWNTDLESFTGARLDDESLLLRWRNYVADYQEARGTPRDEYTFSTLIRVMGQSTGRCLEALFYVLKNIMPVFELFIHIVRFTLDKLLDLNNTEDSQQKVLKILIFMLQLLSVYICLVFIFGFIVSPVIKMAFGILTKILLYD